MSTEYFCKRPASGFEDQVAVVTRGDENSLVEFLEGPHHEERHWVPNTHVRRASDHEETIGTVAAAIRKAEVREAMRLANNRKRMMGGYIVVNALTKEVVDLATPNGNGANAALIEASNRGLAGPTNNGVVYIRVGGQV